MINCWFNGVIPLRKKEIIRISRSIFESEGRHRVTTFENLTSGVPYRSPDEGFLMSVSPKEINPPIIGMIDKIISTTDGKTEFLVRRAKKNLPAFMNTDSSRINIFISSKIDELLSEREKAALAICESNCEAVYWERFGPKETPPEKVWEEGLTKCHIYLGILKKEYSLPTIEEYRMAKELGLQRLVFIEKCQERAKELTEFILKLKEDKEITYKEFDNPSELKVLIRDCIPQNINNLFE